MHFALDFSPLVFAASVHCMMGQVKGRQDVMMTMMYLLP